MEPGTFTEEEISRIKNELKSLGEQKKILAEEKSRLKTVYDLYEELRQWEDKLMETAAVLSRVKEGSPQHREHVERRIRILLYQEKLRSKLPPGAVESEIRSRYLKLEDDYWSTDSQMDQHRRSLIEDVKIKRKNAQ